MRLIKTHALGNDFLLLETGQVSEEMDRSALARAVCNRHRGIGADGLILFEVGERQASMRLLNADGSHSEISGNGVRCLAAWIAHVKALCVGASVRIETEAGIKTLDLVDDRAGRRTFRAAMGPPEHIDRVVLEAAGQTVEAVTLRVGNPQCVVLGEVTEHRLHSIAAALSTHPHFPEGTNVELASVDAPDRVRILIWERGVGPTEASGTGACAAAVAAIRYGNAARDLHVESPGGIQRVEWRDDGLYLTGWAEIIAEVRWVKS